VSQEHDFTTFKPHTVLISAYSPPQNVGILHISRSRDHSIYVATNMREYCYRGVIVNASYRSVRVRSGYHSNSCASCY